MLASRWLRLEEKTGNNPLHRFGRWWDHHFERLANTASRAVPGAVRARWKKVSAS